MKNQKLTAMLLTLGIALGLGTLFALRNADGHEDTPKDANGRRHADHAGQERHENGKHGHEGDHAHGESMSLDVSDSALVASGVTFGRVESRVMALRLPVLGRIVLNENRTAHLHARYPGVILEVKRQLGERVRKGDVLARIESNESLEPYGLLAPKDGVIIGRHATVGESVTPERELFLVSDLSTVWVDLQVYRQDFSRLRIGQRVRLLAEGLPPVETRLSYLAPSVEGHSQAMLARAEVSNPNGLWTPGLFVQGEVAVEDFTALAVPRGAVQEVEGDSVIFVRQSSGRYFAHPVKLGRRDGDWMELVKGPVSGTEYVVGNSYLLKAELGKGEAGHDH